MADPFGLDGAARRASLGRCIGFTVVAAQDGVEFGAGTSVELGPLGRVPATTLDSRHVRVADPETNGACFFTPLFVKTGAWDATVSSAGHTWTIRSAVRMDPAVVVDIGEVDHQHVLVPATGAVEGTSGAFVFEHPWDADVYRARFSEAYHVYAHADFFSADASVVPEMLFWEPAHPETNVARGGFAVVFPQGGEDYFVVRDRHGAGNPGAHYRLAFTGDELGTTDVGDECMNAPPIPARGFHVDYDALHADLDPDGACVDSVYGDPIRAPGKDAVWTVTIPRGQQLRVSTYDDHIDNVTYLLPLGEGCPARPTSCVAAADHFGGGNTNTLIWNNTSAADETFFLVHDSATVMDADVGTFMVNVELFDLP